MIKKVLATSLSVSILLAGSLSQSEANNVNTNSGFYKSARTRQAYINLTGEQRAELDSMNTNNNKWLTIKEVKDHGRYSLPIVQGQSYLYPFMDDRNNNGMVGENETEASESSSGTENNDQEINQEAPEEVTDEEIENLEEDLNSNQENQENPSSNQEIEENPVENQIPSDYLDRLEESLKNAKTTIAGAEILTNSMPNFGEKYGYELSSLIENQKKIISKAEAFLRANGR